MRWGVSSQVTISIFTVLEAESEDQAYHIARDRPMGNIVCCDDADDAWIAEELDGEAQDLIAEKLPPKG